MPREPAVASVDPRTSIAWYLGRLPSSLGIVPRMVAIIVVAAVVALPLVSVDVSVRGTGLVRPSIEKHDLKIAAMGVVDSVFVRLGQEVQAGQRLIRLRTDAQRARFDELSRQLLEREASIHDLRRLGTLDTTTLLGRTRRAIPLGTDRWRADLSRLRQQLQEADLRIHERRMTWDRLRELARGNHVAPAELDNADVALRLSIAGLRTVIEQARAEWAAQLRLAEEERYALEQQRAAVSAEVQQAELVAPVAGTIEQWQPLAAGSRVTVGDRIGVVSPTGTRLVADVAVSPVDIGQLRVGMPVRLHVDAFDYRVWGAIDGMVLAVGDDFLPGNDQRPAFRVVVAPSRATLTLGNGARGDLRKGMSLTARFVVARRSLLQLLIDDAGDWLDPRVTSPVRLRN